jgi:predicted N-acetyltransferase YhbS
MEEVRATGLDAVHLATQLLQRARVADPGYGLWEAADVQWWWRTPRRSDQVEQLFWVDDEGPAAALLVTDFRGTWQVDPFVVPGSGLLGAVWERTLAALEASSPDPAEVPVRDDDDALLAFVHEAGLVPGSTDGVVFLDAADRPHVPLPDGFVLVDRVESPRPHPMRGRNGEAVEERLRECSLYDPGLDLAVETSDGEFAGYSLYWFDPVTKIGLLEPMRVKDAFQRRGLARAMIAAGLERLARRGAQRMKVGYSHAGAQALYTGVGFGSPATNTWFRRPPTGR